MRLRYQMRGLGIGMVVTALLMGVATRDSRPMTDAEIKAKAYTLGMVDGENLSLSDLQGGTVRPSGSGTGATAVPQQTEPPRQTAAPQQTENPQITAEPQETAAPQRTAAPEATQPPRQTETPVENPEQSGAAEPVTIVINRGTDSSGVSRQLAAAGLVEDAAAFDAYLCGNGYADKIQVGTFRVMPGTGWEEIAKTIAGGR